MDTGFTPTFAPTPVGMGGGTPVLRSGMLDVPFQPSFGVSNKNAKLPRDANRILFVRGLPYKITADELYDIFGKYGSVRQIRKGVAPNTKGTAYVVYHDVYDAKNAVDHLSGFNVAGRYLIVVYYDPVKESKREEKKKLEGENELLRQRAGFI